MPLIDKLMKHVLLMLAGVLILSACSKPESSLKPSTANAGSAALQYAFTPTPTLAPTKIPAATEPIGCKTIRMIAICIQNVTRTDTETQVKLKFVVESPMVTVEVGTSFIGSDLQNEFAPILSDGQGHSYSLIEAADNMLIQFDDVQRVYFQTLRFQPVSADAKKLTVSLPMVSVDTPSKAETFQIDLGQNPQPGQTLALNVTATIGGQTFHFVKAEFGGDGVRSLPVTLYMELAKLPDDIFLMSPAFGDPEKGIFFSEKFGTPNIITSDLVVPPGKTSGLTANTYVSGVLNIVVNRITYWYRGPFEITRQLP
ncbi:MAG: hypothetical protein HYR70_03160 [Chloroflexi bacterium]|nr:hypothetical protein [Chloroflexota bacterium]MBI3340008.1 hypothetical protein [Chloroflexota bacterium]